MSTHINDLALDDEWMKLFISLHFRMILRNPSAKANDSKVYLFPWKVSNVFSNVTLHSLSWIRFFVRMKIILAYHHAHSTLYSNYSIVYIKIGSSCFHGKSWNIHVWRIFQIFDFFSWNRIVIFSWKIWNPD